MDEGEEINNNNDEAVVDVTPSAEGSNQRSEFAAVVFQRIPETYPSDAHIECKYTITSDIVPTRSDWIGLFKVGWWTTRDYYYYEWAVIPSDYEAGKEAEAAVLFPAHKMPGDDGEFYQFCYVTSAGQIRGASTPFQFKKPCADDYIEVDDEETDMLVIRSKTAVLEENLHKLEEEKQGLIQMKEKLEKERDTLMVKLASMATQLEKVAKNNEELSDQMNVEKNYVLQMKQEAKDMNLARDALQQKAANITEEKQTIEKRVDTLESEITELKSTIRKIQGEKDLLAGENQTLKEQMELYKNHFTSSETSSLEHQRQIEALQVELVKTESMTSHLQKLLKEVKAKLEEEKKKVEKQKISSKEDKQEIDRLAEKLRNTEDKLSAAEQVKVMLNIEISSHMETQQKLSREIERSENEVHALKHTLNQTENQLASELELLREEIVSAQKDLQEAVDAKNRLQEERDELLQNKEQTDHSLSSLHCLKLAQVSLNERYGKMEQNFQELQNKYSKKKKEYKQSTKDLFREIEDLKERLKMASTEYKNLYIEKKKIQKALEKKEKRKDSLRERVSETSSASPEVMEEKLLTSAAEASTVTSPGSPASSEITIPSQLQRGLDDMENELEKRIQQKKKYKDMYKEEKSKLESLHKMFHDETKVKDMEIERLRKQMEEISSQNENKIRSLENLVAERESTIETLNCKLRNVSQKLQELPSSPDIDKKEKPQSPRSRGPPIPGMAYPVLMYGNPYHSEAPKICYTPSIVFPQTKKETQEPPVAAPKLAYPKYPETRPLEPLRYPSPDVPLKYPEDKPTKDPLSGNELETDCDPSVPLKPLPPPMEPEKLTSSKLMAVKSVLMEGDKNVSEFTVNFSGNRIKLEDEFVLPTAPPSEDKFEDAIGEAMKLCPVCNESFSADVDPKNFEDHVLSHVGRICPFCQNMIEEVDDNGFYHHVTKHLDQSLPTEQ